MKHSLQLKLSQHLTLTPQLQQSIRLLQLSTIELNQELERYLAENPLLERIDAEAESAAPAAIAASGASPEAVAPEPRDEPVNFADESGFGEDAPAGGSRSRDDEERDDFTQFAAAEPTLQEHLLQQLSLTGLTERDRRIAMLLIGHLDEDGYLAPDLEELRESCAQAI